MARLPGRGVEAVEAMRSKRDAARTTADSPPRASAAASTSERHAAGSAESACQDDGAPARGADGVRRRIGLRRATRDRPGPRRSPSAASARAIAPPIRRVPVTRAARVASTPRLIPRRPPRRAAGLYFRAMRIDGSARRRFLGQTAGVGLAVAALLTDDAMARARAAVDRAGDRDPDDVAARRVFWREIQLGIHARSQHHQPEQRRRLAQPARRPRGLQALPGRLEPVARVPHVAGARAEPRSGPAPARRRAGCDPEELAITRNASEALEIAQLGLDLAPGDEVLTTNQDYGRMLDTWEQRVKRDGIVLKKISFPVPPPSLDDLARRFEPP